jgi:hypothetical protein
MLKYSSTDFKIYSPHTPFSYFKFVLLTDLTLQNARKALLEDITHRCRELLDYININIDIDIARVIANPYQLIQHANNLGRRHISLALADVVVSIGWTFPMLIPSVRNSRLL